MEEDFANPFRKGSAKNVIPAGETHENRAKQAANIDTSGDDIEIDNSSVNENSVANECNSESKGSLSKKLQATEEILRDMTQKMEKLQRQRDKVQAELDRVNTELSNAKAQRTIIEEHKVETENSLKAEIKQLITKLMKTKEKIAQNMQPSPSPVPVPAPQKHLRSNSTCGTARPRNHRQVQGGATQQQMSENVGPKSKAMSAKKCKDTPLTAQSMNEFPKISLFPSKLVSPNKESKEPSVARQEEDDNKNCSDDLDEYESNQKEENLLGSSTKKLQDFSKKSLQDLS